MATTSTNKARTRAIAVSAVLALSLSSGLMACGSDDEPAARSDETTTTAVVDDSTTTPEAVEPGDEGEAEAEVTPKEAEVLVGMSELAAEAKSLEEGWTVRVLERDGEMQVATNDFNPTRINVTVVKGEITEIQSIG